MKTLLKAKAVTLKKVTLAKNKAKVAVKKKAIVPAKHKEKTVTVKKATAPAKQKAKAVVVKKVKTPIKHKAKAIAVKKISTPAKQKTKAVSTKKANAPLKQKAKAAVVKKATTLTKAKQKNTGLKVKTKSPEVNAKIVVEQPVVPPINIHGEDLHFIPQHNGITYPVTPLEIHKMESIFHRKEEVALHQENRKMRNALPSRKTMKVFNRNRGGK